MMKSKKELFRNEWKYLISEGEKELLRLRMSPFLHLDPHADEGGYMIRSLYLMITGTVRMRKKKLESDAKKISYPNL